MAKTSKRKNISLGKSKKIKQNVIAAGKSKTIKRNVIDAKRSKKIRRNVTDAEKSEKIVKVTKKDDNEKKKRYSEMSVDDFLNTNFEESNTDPEDAEDADSKSGDEHENRELHGDISQNQSDEDEDIFHNSDESDGDGSEDEVVGHKESLAKLKDTDPEFYKFLQENDKALLNFDLSDSENEQGVDEDDDEGKMHKPGGDLEVASDESDFEDETKPVDSSVITLKMLKSWQNDIQTDKSNVTIVKLVKAFHAAILRVSDDNEDRTSPYKVEGSAIFNGVIQVCVLQLGPAIRRYLGIPQGSKQPPHKCKKFVKIKAVLRGYFVDLLKLLGGVTSTNILTVLLKHLHYMSSMIASYGNVMKLLVKKLIRLWGTGDESVRVIAFLCIVRLINNQHNNLETVLKSMYMTYVQNSKFVSPSTLPMINFMRRSLVEIYSIDPGVSYRHVFLYVRQLAIHLRNAVTVKKKENIQAVYNWQFVNSLKLWGNLLSATHAKPQLQPLMYPFVQVCLGMINLIPTTQYYPLRFHVAEILIEFSAQTAVFVPILPFLLEILTLYDFNKKHQKVSMKPMKFLCILRLSKSQLMENGFKDALIDAIYGQLLEYLAANSHSIAFPDLSLLCIIQIKAFLKKCSVASYCRKMRQILEKIEQNNKFIQSERRNVSFNLSETKRIEAWEAGIRSKGTPLATFYQSWKSVRDIKRNKDATNNEAIGEYDLPVLKKRECSKNADEDSDGKLVLFPSDSESEGEKEKEGTGKRKRGKRGGKNINKKVAVAVSLDNEDDGVKDVVEDLKLEDW